jgi:uncharacterized protein YjiS (DUF1127 family)
MTTRAMPAIALPAGRVAAHEHGISAAVHSSWTAFCSMLARAAARRRLARSIAHLDDRLLADAGLTTEHRGLGDRLIRHFAVASEMLTGINAQRG